MRPHYDDLAVDLLLAGDTEGLALHAAIASALVENRLECPECGDEGPHEDNGASGAELSFACRVCGTCFDAEDDL